MVKLNHPYLSSQYFGSDWGKILSHTNANGFSQLKMKLFANREGVEKVGVHLVYKKEILDPNQTMAQCINNSNILYEDLADSEIPINLSLLCFSDWVEQLKTKKDQ